MKIHLLFHPYWSIWPNDQLDKLNILISQLEVNLCCNRSRIKSNIEVPTTQVAIGVHQLGTTYMLPHHLVATVPVFKIYHLPGYKQCPGRTQTMDSFLHNWIFFSLWWSLFSIFWYLLFNILQQPLSHCLKTSHSWELYNHRSITILYFWSLFRIFLHKFSVSLWYFLSLPCYRN